MELRRQDQELGMPSPLAYNNPSNRDSSSKLSSAAAPVNSAAGERRRDQSVQGDTILNTNLPNLDNQSLHPHQLNPQHHLNKPRRDPDSDRDPDPVQVPAPIAAVSATATANRPSILKPAQQQLPPAAPASTTVASAAPLVRYRECLKNHAASKGSHVVDGCGEFMPSGEEGTPEALNCAACECHRNFHRKEINGESQYAPNFCYTYNNPSKTSTRRDGINHGISLHQHPPPQLSTLHQHRFSFSHGLSTTPSAVPIAPVMMAFGGGGGPAESSSEDLNMFHQSDAGGQSSGQPSSSSKKRFRTKFSQEQKDKMMELAEKLGWKIQKQDEQEVQQLCAQVGVKRKVFKVWMHNNKQAMKKKQM